MAASGFLSSIQAFQLLGRCHSHPSSQNRALVFNALLCHSGTTLDPSPSLSLLRNSKLQFALLPLHYRGKRTFLVQAAANEGGPGEASKTPYGLGGPGTWFGFGRKQERQVGRLAMVGFVAGVVMEVLTGKGVLGQLGIDAVAVRFPFLAGFLFLLVGGLLGGYVVINNPPDTSKAPPNEGAGLPRDPLKTYDPQNLDPLTTWTRGGVVNRSSGQGREPYVSDLDLPPPKKKESE